MDEGNDFLTLSLNNLRQPYNGIPYTQVPHHTEEASNSRMQLSFFNESQASPWLSLNCTQEEAPRRPVHDPRVFSGHTVSPIEPRHNLNNGGLQSVACYLKGTKARLQSHPYATVRTRQGLMFRVPRQSFPNNYHQGSSYCTPHRLAPTELDYHAPITQMNLPYHQTGSQPLGVQNQRNISVPSPVSSGIGGTNLSFPKSSEMIVFDEGAMHEYENVSPDTAREIMKLAGDGSSGSKKWTLATTQVQDSTLRPTQLDNFGRNPRQPASQFTCIPNPVPFHPAGQQVHGASSSRNDGAPFRIIQSLPPFRSSSNPMIFPAAGQPSQGTSSSSSSRTDGAPFRTMQSCLNLNNPPEPHIANARNSSLLMIAEQLTGGESETRGVITSPYNANDTIRLSSSVGSFSRPGPPGENLPFARKASLARFLDRRRDRVTLVSPYSHRKNYPEHGANDSANGSLSRG